MLFVGPAGLHLAKPPLLLTGIPIRFKAPALTHTHISLGRGIKTTDKLG